MTPNKSFMIYRANPTDRGRDKYAFEIRTSVKCVYKKKQSYLGAFICVPVFILAGSEHSIADMYYFCAAGVFSLDALFFIILVAIGNAIGGIIIPVCQKYMYEEQPAAKA